MNNTFILFFRAVEQSMIFNISVLVYFKLSICVVPCLNVFHMLWVTLSTQWTQRPCFALKRHLQEVKAMENYRTSGRSCLWEVVGYVRGSSYRVLIGKILVFWIGGWQWEVVAHVGSSVILFYFGVIISDMNHNFFSAKKILLCWFCWIYFSISDVLTWSSKFLGPWFARWLTCKFSSQQPWYGFHGS